MKVISQKIVVIIEMQCFECQRKYNVDIMQIDDFMNKNEKCVCGHIFKFSVVIGLAKEIIGKDGFIDYLNSQLKGRTKNFSPYDYL